jgi:hypothetical protein
VVSFSVINLSKSLPAAGRCEICGKKNLSLQDQAVEIQTIPNVNDFHKKGSGF